MPRSIFDELIPDGEVFSGRVRIMTECGPKAVFELNYYDHKTGSHQAFCADGGNAEFLIQLFGQPKSRPIDLSRGAHK